MIKKFLLTLYVLIVLSSSGKADEQFVRVDDSKIEWLKETCDKALTYATTGMAVTVTIILSIYLSSSVYKVITKT